MVGRPDTVVVADLFAGADRARLAGDPDGVRAERIGERLVVRAEAPGLAVLPLEIDGEPAALAVQAEALPRVTFRYQPEPGPAPAVFVIGGFNDWSRSATPLRPAPDGALAATVPVAPGRYEYKLTVDGAEVLDPASRDSVANPFGAYNNVLVVPPAVDGGLRARVVAAASDDPSLLVLDVRSVAADGAESLPAEVDDDDGAVVLDGNRVVDDNAVYFDPDAGRISIDLDALQPGARRLRIAVRDGARVSPWVEVPVVDRRASATTSAAPWSWNDAVIYQVVVDRFYDGDPSNSRPVVRDGLDPRANYQGGDLAGVLARLRDGTFERLGVNALWLSPVVENPQAAYREYPAPHRLYAGYHGYWPVQPRAVDPRLGTMDDLRAVVGAAHDRGIKVLLDFVANHVHEDHPYVAAHPDWFGTLELPDGSLNVRRFDEYRLTTWFEPYLPSFDFQSSPEAVAQVTADAEWWLRESGADGFRQDAVKHIPTAFWRAMTDRLADGGERPFQIGETFGSYDLVASYVAPGLLDAQFNFALYDAAVSAFARDGSLAALADEVDKSLQVFGPLPLSFLYWMQTEAPRHDGGGKGYPEIKLRPDIVGTLDGLAKYPYIRESRRILAEFTICEQHVASDSRPDGAETFPIALASAATASICIPRPAKAATARTATITLTSAVGRFKSRSARSCRVASIICCPRAKTSAPRTSPTAATVCIRSNGTSAKRRARSPRFVWTKV